MGINKTLELIKHILSQTLRFILKPEIKFTVTVCLIKPTIQKEIKIMFIQT
jgi:hypothetical protein